MQLVLGIKKKKYFIKINRFDETSICVLRNLPLSGIYYKCSIWQVCFQQKRRGFSFFFFFFRLHFATVHRARTIAGISNYNNKNKTIYIHNIIEYRHIIIKKIQPWLLSHTSPVRRGWQPTDKNVTKKKCPVKTLFYFFLFSTPIIILCCVCVFGVMETMCKYQLQ